ncbi:MAG: DUF411 domain-containing protein, partial [Gammaproteobacteria bacterium]
MKFSRITRGFLLALLLVAAPGFAAEPAAMQPVVKVWKTPTCGCCGKWVKHLQASGFRVEVTDLPSVDGVRAANGVPARLSACHTAVVGGYVIEGHVPASDVRRLLAEKPGILGLSAPGMPAGSPGMDVPGSPAYDVISFDKDGRTAVY